jgi:hypothetical protein
MPPPKLNPPSLLRDARVYLSGPMDFVASRADEMQTGWRNRVGEFLRRMGVTVFDPWTKPDVRGLHEYGRENTTSTSKREEWTFAPGKSGAKRRAACSEAFWPALHVDLRMVDTSDFVIAYCPTNVYSVGTPHEIIMARTQRKPVLFVSPRVRFDSLATLKKHLRSKNDKEGLEYLAALERDVPINENSTGAPSLWYLPLVGGEHFFDGFGFDEYRHQFGWNEATSLENREAADPPVKPLLPFLAALNDELPKRWNRHLKKFDVNDDWLLWDIRREKGESGGRWHDVHRGS